MLDVPRLRPNSAPTEFKPPDKYERERTDALEELLLKVASQVQAGTMNTLCLPHHTLMWDHGTIQGDIEIVDSEY
jgi:hypothetical protein